MLGNRTYSVDICDDNDAFAIGVECNGNTVKSARLQIWKGSTLLASIKVDYHELMRIEHIINTAIKDII